MAGPPRLPASIVATGAPVVALHQVGAMVAAALGDGRIWWGEPDDIASQPVEPAVAHDGALLCAAVGPDGRSLLSGGDDGRLVRLQPGSEPEEVAKAPRRWIAALATDPQGGNIVFAAGKEARVLGKDGREKAVFADHPSTIADLALDAKGKRLAVAHYGGASIWWTELAKQEPKKLAWKGSHVRIRFDPTGRYLVTAMQENELHGWRLADGQDMRMSGYPSKPRALAFSPDGKKLATGGSDTLVVWDFTGKGPMGKAPDELGDYCQVPITALAFHPTLAIVAAGHADGSAKLLSFGSERTIPLDNPGADMVTSLVFSRDGRKLYAGTEDGGLASYLIAN
ncbi:WD40 repeat domain-containing protein [Geminicoccus roseus]|uniref:WD40 repeat domain-containing protein n=1 Tax=Geminicoccus roseus TaxID=404900 RepID=UPI00040EA959|nr:hypothetical protein [Geminicoccus roseus]